jgi:hypothetical protein
LGQDAFRLILLSMGSIYFLRSVLPAQAQERIQASVSKLTISLGESVLYQVEVTTAGEKQSTPDITLPPVDNQFQIGEVFTRSAVNILNGQTYITTIKEAQLTAKAKGVVIIPGSQIEMLDSKTNQRTRLTTNPIKMQVNEPTGQTALPTPTPEIDILKPNKTLAGINPSQWLPYAITLGGLVFFLGFMTYLRRRPQKPAAPMKPKDPRTPEQRAMDALKAALKLKADQTLNPFYTSLSLILRRYLAEAFDFKAEEATTNELLAEMEKLEFKSEFLNKCKEYFSELDAVKFAGLTPPQAQVESALPKAQELILSKEKRIPQPPAVSSSTLPPVAATSTSSAPEPKATGKA